MRTRYGGGSMDDRIALLGANGSPTSSAEILLRNNGLGTFSNVSGNISGNVNVDDLIALLAAWGPCP